MRRKTKYTLRSDGRIVMSKTVDGQRKMFYGRSDAEVEQKYAEYLNSLKQAKKCRTLKTVAEDWWNKKEPKLSPNSLNGYKVAMRRAVSEFGEIPVDEITPNMVLTYLGKFSAQDFSYKVISNSKSVLKKILDDAFIAGEIDRNPCSGLPQIDGKAKVRRQPASPSDIKLITEHKNDSDIARMYFFMLYTGLRRGETVALQYKHIDRVNKTVRVDQSCAWDNSKPVLKQPKTEAGIRTVDLVDAALSVIPCGHDPEEYIFFPEGLPRRRAIEAGLEEYRNATGVKATPHQLRHSFASMLHSAGVDVKDAQALLGHSTIQMTQDIYTHLEQEHRKNVRSKLNQYVAENR